jgi:hypothetical protein
MFAGVPGIGVGTLFYVITALVMPLVELTRLLRGDVSAARWRLVLTQFCFATSVILSVAVADRVLSITLRERTITNVNVARVVNDVFHAKARESIWAAPVMASVLLLVAVLAAMEVLRLLMLLKRPALETAVNGTYVHDFVELASSSRTNWAAPSEDREADTAAAIASSSG